MCCSCTCVVVNVVKRKCLSIDLNGLKLKEDIEIKASDATFRAIIVNIFDLLWRRCIIRHKSDTLLMALLTQSTWGIYGILKPNTATSLSSTWLDCLHSNRAFKNRDPDRVNFPLSVVRAVVARCVLALITCLAFLTWLVRFYTISLYQYKHNPSFLYSDNSTQWTNVD